MKIEKIDMPAAGTWARDCELLCLSDHTEFKLEYHKDEDDTYWVLRCAEVVAYKVINEEFYLKGYLLALPEGAFFEILDSPWIGEFRKEKDRILDTCKHYVLLFYDETVEIIAQKFTFEQLQEKPTSFLSAT
ncbi:MAG: hypothetical protein AAGI90_06720 [Chlamydiota bacterium]